MMQNLFRVLSQSEAVNVTKQDGTQIQKATIVLQTIDGKYGDSFAATMLGANATLRFYCNDLVWASLRFNSHEYQGQHYQDVILQDIAKLNLDSSF